MALTKVTRLQRKVSRLKAKGEGSRSGERGRISPFIRTPDEAKRTAKKLRGKVAYSTRLRRYYVTK